MLRPGDPAFGSRVCSASDGVLAVALQSVVLHPVPGDPVPGGGVRVLCLLGVLVLPGIVLVAECVLHLTPITNSTNPGGGVWF